MKSLKYTFAFFKGPFTIWDIVEDGFPISEIILIENEAGELKFL